MRDAGEEKRKPRPIGAEALLRGYGVPPGIADELFDATGTMRPVWRPFVDLLSRQTPDAIAQRFERGNQYLRDAGVYFRSYAGDPLEERDWPLSSIPVLLDEAEWQTICAGLAQRADLLEAVIADLYGPGRLVADGHLPAALVAGNPHWTRPMVGVPPVGGRYLHFIAFELGRSPDGSWLVLGDRTQAPSGAGFALENRMATRRIYPDAWPSAHVHRLSGFFEAFRETLERLSRDPGGARRTFGLLTPGRANDAFFEHFYIARYLGIPLLEGEDVIVEDATALLRTITGPVPLGVLWRRIDTDFADPLELDPMSRIGVPGLVQAVRSGALAMVNALGSGVLEARAMMAFLPRISEVLTGAPLALPNIATWWCGGAAEKAFVRQNRDRMIVGPALTSDLPFARRMDRAVSEDSDFDLGEAADAAHLVGQEAVTLSTTPRWIEDDPGGRLAPCPMTVRVFAARTEAGWTFLQGGYARVGPVGDTSALSMQRGGTVADVWVTSTTPVPAQTASSPSLTISGTTQPLDPRKLPTRAADNLYWLGRYIVRFEDAARLSRAWHLRRATVATPEDPVLSRITRALADIGIEAEDPLSPHLVGHLKLAQGCAERIRDRFSIDGWQALDDLAKTMRQFGTRLQAGDDAARAMGVLLRKLAGFSGLVADNMYRGTGWRFLNLGRALERASGLCAILTHFAIDGRARGTLEVALEVGDGAMTHRRLHALDATDDSVMALLLRDAENPRSLVSEVDEMLSILRRLPGGGKGAARATEDLLSEIEDLQRPVTTRRLLRWQSAVADISDRVTAEYLR